MLTLTIKKKWFDIILSGEKKEEYREIKPYYDSRFLKSIEDTRPHTDTLLLRNGYGKDKPTLRCECIIYKGHGKKEWGAIPGNVYYVLKILSVEEVKVNE
ncbi:MAG TPA: hypothetical protein DCE23_04335 [Firmicutes bacterium]|nr:hypothetical protein [Bacillota bacterium]